MAYHEPLADRTREALAFNPALGEKDVEEKKMMGGLAFMVDGKMCVGIVKDALMVRVAPEAYDASLKRKGCRQMDFTGKVLKGFVLVDPEGTKTKKDLDYWVSLALAFNDAAVASRKKE